LKEPENGVWNPVDILILSRNNVWFLIETLVVVDG
jgi:hypothetical protein